MTMGLRSFAAATLILTLMLAVTARAHIVVDEPWHPASAAYRTTVFLIDLEPIDWELVKKTYEAPIAAAVGSRTAKSIVREITNGLKLDAAIDRAITRQDPQAVYESMTRAMSNLIRHELAGAAEEMSKQGQTHQKVLDAQAIYRAFGDFITQADPAGARQLGLAWLELTNSIGSVGVLGRGVTDADKLTFESSSQIISDYFIANFEPDQYAHRAGYVPLPETVIAAKGEVAVSPWLPPGSNMNDQDPLPLLILNFEEQGIDEADLPMVAYGDMLFDSPEIFGDPARSLGLTCSTCHNRSDINQAFFIPGISSQPGAIDVDGHFFNSIFNDRRSDALDIPSLRGLRFTAPYGRDGRIASLREFTRNVIVGEFAGAEPTPFMLDALVAYQFEFDWLPNSKLDAEGMLTDQASAAAKRGEVLFRRPISSMDGKSCASCHEPSSNFLDRKAHNIGSGAYSYDDARDGAFDTPTLLGANFTAPYFHDGSLPTLASVVDWFDDNHEIGLSDAERSDLTAYLEAVGDSDNPYEEFNAERTKFRLGWEELTTFATTLNTLIPLRDAFHSKLMIDTVAADLAADASGMVNLRAKTRVYEMASILGDVGKAIDSDNWEAAERLWTKFQAAQIKIDQEMY